MVYYECQRCGYNTTLRGNIKHHLNRKNICEPILDNISIEEMKDIYNLNEINKIHQKTPRKTLKKWILRLVLIVIKSFHEEIV